MSRRTSALGFTLAICLVAGRTLAQEPEPKQDPKLDNLVHAPGYKTAELGSLGAVVERGTGPVDMLLVSGFGVGASAFEGFLKRNETRYHMLAITLPGFEGTQAPPMPPAGTSYGEQTWTRAAAKALAELIGKRKLVRPVLVGHFINGTQIAAQVALDHPELARALVLLAGTPRYAPLEATPFWPKDQPLEKQVAMVDSGLAPRWFKTVTRKTWVGGNFVATDYSIDEARGKRMADLANEPPLPVLIRYLCEFHASDLRPVLAQLKLPLLLVQPTFTEELRADTKRNYLKGYFEEPWKGLLEDRPHTQKVLVPEAGILLLDDKPVEVDRALADFLEKHAP